MVTLSFCFPHHVSRQTELRLPLTLVGSPVTATLPLPYHVSQQVEVRSVRTYVGSPVTATIAFASPPTLAELRSAIAHVGSPVSATLAFAPSSLFAELRSFRAHVGSPVTTAFAFSPPLAQTALRWVLAQTGSHVTAKFLFPKLPTQLASIRWNAERRVYTATSIYLRNDYHNLTTSSIYYNYDWKTIFGTAFRYRHWSVVKPGWRIIAKNIVTGESLELGFIDTENPSLEDVFLPDGDYEISVLTSSLFWKDCLDRTVRTIAIRPGEEVTPLPTIYNLRSAVLNGVTTIRWSANMSELSDCVFGIWYDSQSPVDTNKPPDATIGYYPSQTEYATIFYQNAPAWVAVAAIRTGDNSELGKVHELYLDWSDVPPRRPDDVVVMNAPLPVIAAVEKHNENGDLGKMWGD